MMFTLPTTRLIVPFGILILWLMPAVAFGQLTDTTRVAIHEMGDYYEMENGFLGVRIPKSSLFDPDAPAFVPAPLAAVVYKDGSLSNDFQNYLVSTTPALTMADSVLYESDDSCAIRISYTFDKPPLINASGQLEPAGPGYYRVTLKMIKGEKVCCVLEESDFEISYDLKVSDGLSPDKGRYIGHHATTIVNGYDIWNNVYVKNDTTGYHATVDLAFNQRKEYPLTSRWNPFVVNSGWHWQLYNSTAPPTANTFGVFDGATSRLLGVEASGVGVFTQPASLEDIHSACDTIGNCHFVWRTEEEIWYKKVDANGTWSTETLVASGLINPFVFAFDNTVNILAVDPLAAPGEQIVLLKKIGSGSFQSHTLTLDATLTEPYAYGASDGVHDFILFEGVRNNLGGYQLYSAAYNDTIFTYADRLANGGDFRASNRPDMKRTPQGDILVIYTENVSYQSYNLIANGTTTFTTILPLPFGTTAITFGMNVDTRTGDFFWVKNDGSINYVDMDGADVLNTFSTPVGAYVEHGGFNLPNRRSIATDLDTNALAYHEGFYYFFDQGTKTWNWLNNAAWDAIVPACIYFNTTDEKFFIVGKYQGKLARFSYVEGGNPVLEESFSSTERKIAGIKSIHKRIAPTGNYYPDIRFEWCIYAGKKNTDLPAANQVQPIALAMNRVSGLASKLAQYENEALIFDPSFENGGLYMAPAELQAIIQQVKTDVAFYDQMVAVDPLFKDVLDAWQDPTTVKTTQLYNKITAYSTALKNALTNGDGIYSYYYLYTTAANLMRRYTDQMSALMADTKLTASQRTNLKKTAALFARILWDDDFVPLFEEHGLSLGTPNMVQAYTGQRWFFALILHDDPEFSARAAQVPVKLSQVLSAQVNAAGAARGTPHYLQPTMDLVTLTGLQMRNAGIEDIFQDNDTIRLFADFVLHLLTPTSVRFSAGTKRKLVVFGDGTEESAAIFGLLGTGFASVNPLLSKRLMQAYRNGPARSSDYGFVTMSINHNLPDTSDLYIGNAHFPGYFSNFRAAVGTDKETSTGFIHGEWYADHRNDDRGTLSSYALGAPLSLNFGSLFQPSVTGAHMKSTPVLLSEFPQWNQANQPFLLPGNLSWYTSQHDEYMAFKNSAYSKATFTRADSWSRQVFQFVPNDQMPVIVVKDTFSNTAAEYIHNFNFAASGVVQTPNGPVTPPSTIWNQNGGPTQLPSASANIPLAAGMRRFDFTGSSWSAHPAGGIDFEVYLPSAGTNDANLAEWAHTFSPSVESDEYQAINGSSFVERQTILRVKGAGGFLTIIIPYFKGQRPANLSVNRSGDTLLVNADGFDFETDLNYYTFEGGGKTVLASFNSQLYSHAGASIEDGPMELEINQDTAFARLHGSPGIRRVLLPPGSWTIAQTSPNATYDAGTGKWLLNHIFVDSLHNSFSGGYTEFAFVKTILVALKILLEGPYNPGNSSMNDNLRSAGNVPLEEPYTALGFDHYHTGGGETVEPAVFNTTGNNAIVDWVLLELRDKQSPGSVIATRAALLQRDGDVVELDGVSAVAFHDLAADSFYVALRHRNHMGVMTANAVELGTGGATGLDFTATGLSVWGTDARKNLGGGKWGLYAADMDLSGSIDATDRSSIWNERGMLGYLLGDVNMDGIINGLDRNLVWMNRNKIQQLP